jgi:hypothetical protein
MAALENSYGRSMHQPELLLDGGLKRPCLQDVSYRTPKMALETSLPRYPSCHSFNSFLNTAPAHSL